MSPGWDGHPERRIALDLVEADRREPDAPNDDRRLAGLLGEHPQGGVGVADEPLAADVRAGADEQLRADAGRARRSDRRSRSRPASGDSGRPSRAACRGSSRARRRGPRRGPRRSAEGAGRGRTRCPRQLPRVAGRARWSCVVLGRFSLRGNPSRAGMVAPHPYVIVARGWPRAQHPATLEYAHVSRGMTQSRNDSLSRPRGSSGSAPSSSSSAPPTCRGARRGRCS